MNDILTWLHSLASNPMFTGLTGATVIGGLLVMARQVPVRLAVWGMGAVSAQVTVKSQDPAFWWIVHWLSASKYGSTARRMRLETGASHGQPTIGRPDNASDEASYVLSPADGTHWFLHRRTLIVLVRGKEGGGPAAGNTFLREEVSLRAFGWRPRKFLHEVIDEARAQATMDDDCIKVHTHQSWDWLGGQKVSRRPIESVILRAGVADRLVDDARVFLQSREWYRDRAIPWRRGYLLYGPPGCGKSSIAHALASHLGMHVAVLSPSGLGGDNALRNLLQTIPPRSLLLIEDIDSAFNQREKKDVEFVTFSGLLNAIDGLAAAEGRILMMTTNHIDHIDAALRRPGRSDVELEILPADADQARRMFLRFHPERADCADAFAGEHAGKSPALIQGVLLERSFSP